MRCRIIIVLLACMTVVSCRHDVMIFPVEEEDRGEVQQGPVTGFYLLNEGNMGSNKCTLDFYDYGTATYTRNIYGNANPDVVKELGDVGNDLQIYGSKLWAVVNCSNKIEVMDAGSARRIGQVDIPNCRYIAFNGGYAYCTSYAGPVQIDPDYKQLGYVAKIDTATLEVVDRCVVGFQPDGIAVVDGRIYVANSGGYMPERYENTLSVVDIATFSEMGRINVAVNLHNVLADRMGRLWVTSRGDYYDTMASLYMVDNLGGDSPRVREVTDEYGAKVAVAAMCLCGDSIYYVGNQFSYITYQNDVTYGIIDVNRASVVNRGFISDGSDARISMPYSIAVNPTNDEILIGDAKNYVNPGRLFCYGADGILKWDVRTGDIPAHIVFVY